MQKEIFELLEKYKVKLSKVEIDLGTPKNYLSRFKNPKNKLPQKWVDKLLTYIKTDLGDLQDKITYEVKIADGFNMTSEPIEWVKEIEEYCELASCTPSDLIDAHRNQNKATVAKKTGKDEQNQPVSYIGNPKTKIVNPVYEGSNAFFLRHGARTWAEVEKLKQEPK